jgi:hypothetical protein
VLVNCVAYQEGTKLSDISKEDISEYVKRPDCFVWVGGRTQRRTSSRKCARNSACTSWPSKTRAMATREALNYRQ